MDEKKAHEAFAQIWNMFNTVRKNNSDAGWAACAAEARRIARENPERMYEKIILSMIGEAEEEAKITDAAQRQLRYKAAAKAFNGAWELYLSLLSGPDINTVAAYCNANTGKLAKESGAAIYEAACGKKNPKGSFMEAAWKFYARYQDGLDENAMAEAEIITDRYPEHTLQMMELCDGLKKRSEAKAAEAVRAA